MSKFHKTSTDSLLLEQFCCLSANDSVLEIGCGEGYIMRCNSHCQLFLSVDINPLYIPLWKKKDSHTRSYYIAADARLLPQIVRCRFSVVICNPPYHRMGEGRLSPYYYRAIARHEVALTIFDVFKVSQKLLTDNGRLYLIHLFSRMPEIIEIAEDYGFFLKKHQFAQQDIKQKDRNQKVLFCFTRNTHTGQQRSEDCF